MKCSEEEKSALSHENETKDSRPSSAWGSDLKRKREEEKTPSEEPENGLTLRRSRRQRSTRKNSDDLLGGPCSASSSIAFPKKLLALFKEEDRDVIDWLSHGHAFSVLDNDQFVKEVLPKYFRHNKLTSFQRQLNLYGFRRITKGEDSGAYYHPYFKRGRPELMSYIKRMPRKGSASGHGNQDAPAYDASVPAEKTEVAPPATMAATVMAAHAQSATTLAHVQARHIQKAMLSHPEAAAVYSKLHAQRMSAQLGSVSAHAATITAANVAAAAAAVNAATIAAANTVAVAATASRNPQRLAVPRPQRPQSQQLGGASLVASSEESEEAVSGILQAPFPPGAFSEEERTALESPSTELLRRVSTPQLQQLAPGDQSSPTGTQTILSPRSHSNLAAIAAVNNHFSMSPKGSDSVAGGNFMMLGNLKRGGTPPAIVGSHSMASLISLRGRGGLSRAVSRNSEHWGDLSDIGDLGDFDIERAFSPALEGKVPLL